MTKDTVLPHESDASSTDPLRSNTHDFDIEAQDTQPRVNQRRVTLDTTSATAFPNADTGSIRRNAGRSNTMMSRSTMKSLRRRGKTETANVAYSAVEMGKSTGWAPGSEPGFNPNKPPSENTAMSHDDGHLCEITCVDYSVDNMAMVNLDNTNLQEHLERPKPDWAQVRWINVNGLSRDVVRVIGSYKGLHPLALEDLMNTKSRTKADWYSDHTFVVLPLQRLVHMQDDDDDSDSDDDTHSDESSQIGAVDGKLHNDGKENGTHFLPERDRRRYEEKHRKKGRGVFKSLIRDVFRRKSQRKGPNSLTKTTTIRSSKVTAPWIQDRQDRSLQRYHGGPNQDRIAWFERNAVLSSRGLGVSMEQVSIFLTADNTVISFFEYSAQDVEAPIIRRLQTEGTILRESEDASMLMQSILDAIIDLAIPVTVAYQDALGDLELEVLTDPDIRESKTLYILTSEIAVLRNAIAPVVQLMSALKDHKTKISLSATAPTRISAPAPQPTGTAATDFADTYRPTPSHRASGHPSSGVNITHLTVTYLGDIEDHALLIQDSYDQMRRSADNLVDLIFNTVSAYQNESMKQLTVVTCFFLPLTFLTGYFGMNFDTFDAVKNNSDSYFWIIAIPVSVVVFVILLRDIMLRVLWRWANKALISRLRKRRLARGT